MLSGMRKASRSWLGKLIVAVLFGLLIVSFAIWGIGDIFRGGVQRTVARVGDADISAETLRNAYQQEVQRLQRQVRQSITPERARLLGIDTRVLSRLITEGVLDQQARRLGLAASDDLVARSILEDPAFRGANGQFDRAGFEEALRNNNYTVPAFEREQRSTLLRLQLAEAIGGGLHVPLAAREAAHRYGAERRAAAYVSLPPAAAGEVPAPTDEQLKGFYEERKGSFRAPEYRTLNVLVLDPKALARPDQVSEADARRRYEEVKGARFGTPERRTIQQMVFPSREEAEAALARIKAGTPFETVASERGLAERDIELGTLARADVIDPAVAEAAFSLQEGGVGGPIQGSFGPVLVRAAKVLQGNVRPFEEVAAELRGELALERAGRELEAVHDAVEDLRAGAKPLADIARDKGLALVTTPPVDRNGADRSGNPTQIPEREAVLPAAFASDVGADNEALRPRGGGYVWYEVARIDPARDRSLDEVRAEVERQWREDEVSRRLTALSRSLVERLDKGERIDAVAAELSLAVRTVEELGRGAARDDLSTDAVARVFATPVDKAGSAAGAGGGRVVFRVTGATVPPFVTSTQEAQRLEEQLRLVLSDDLLSQFIAQGQKTIGVRVNQDAVRRAIGGET